MAAWSLGLPHQATVSAKQGGEWQLSVRHERSFGWVWRVSHSDLALCEHGVASSAGMAISRAEYVATELDDKEVDSAQVRAGKNR